MQLQLCFLMIVKAIVAVAYKLISLTADRMAIFAQQVSGIWQTPHKAQLVLSINYVAGSTWVAWRSASLLTILQGQSNQSSSLTAWSSQISTMPSVVSKFLLFGDPRTPHGFMDPKMAREYSIETDNVCFIVKADIQHHTSLKCDSLNLFALFPAMSFSNDFIS